MTFVQPFLLFALPLALLPVVIHLLNRLRYRTVRWAAIMFVSAASRSSIRRARLRHYIILALRMMSVAFLILAFARPLAGGWVGRMAAGAPDAVFLALDRSASMEAAAGGKSLREQSIELFIEGAEPFRARTLFVLADSATLSVQEIKDMDVLRDLTLCRATSTATDIPVLIRRILEYVSDNSTGNYEIWVASDMQASNWRLNSQEWDDLVKTITGNSQRGVLRVLALSRPESLNLSLMPDNVQRIITRSGDLLQLGFGIRSSGNLPSGSVPVWFAVEGVKHQEDADLANIHSKIVKTFALAEGQSGAGWGSVEVPSDSNEKDNSLYFAYSGRQVKRSVVVAEDRRCGGVLGLAAAPDPVLTKQAAEMVKPSDLAGVMWNDLSLLIWQRESAAGMDSIAESFLAAGGTIILFPPGRKASGILGLEWDDVDVSGNGSFAVATWDSVNGPLASSSDGSEIPVGSLQVARRQIPSNWRETGFSWRTVAAYDDGRPFLLGAGAANGTVYVCTTLPLKEWSNLDSGPVLVPMIQRALGLGFLRLSDGRNGEAGLHWSMNGNGSVPVDQQEKSPLLDAGVYLIDGRLTALNVPAEEHDDKLATEAQIRDRLAGVDVSFNTFDALNERKSSEIWPLFLALMAITIISEAWLLSRDGDSIRKGREVK